MRSQKLMAVTTVVVLAALAIPIQPAAQNKQDHKHHHYQLIDMGTLGVAQSTVAPGRVLNNEGTVVGCADTSTPDPNYPNFREEEAGQTLPRTTDKAQDDYLAADKILFETLSGRCLVHFETMTGYCIAPPGGVCHSDYKPSFCPPGMRVKHIKTFQCAGEFAYVAAHRTCP